MLLMFKKQGQKHMWFCCVKIQHIEFCRDTSSTDIALGKKAAEICETSGMDPSGVEGLDDENA